MAKKKKSKGKKGSKALKRILLLILVLLILFGVMCFITPTEGEMEGYGEGGEIIGLEIPSGGKGEIIEHTGYTLSYREEYEVPEWVAYELTREEVTTKREYVSKQPKYKNSLNAIYSLQKKNKDNQYFTQEFSKFLNSDGKEGNVDYLKKSLGDK